MCQGGLEKVASGRGDRGIGPSRDGLWVAVGHHHPDVINILMLVMGCGWPDVDDMAS